MTTYTVSTSSTITGTEYVDHLPISCASTALAIEAALEATPRGVGTVQVYVYDERGSIVDEDVLAAWPLESLDDLLTSLQADDRCRVSEAGELLDQPNESAFGDWIDLLTFGGTDPGDNGYAVWSWDAKRLLLGSCADDLAIVDLTTLYRWRTDAASGEVRAADAAATLATLISECEWSSDDSADIADGAWLQISDADGVAVLTRGQIP